MRVLVVDDDDAIRTLVMRLVTRAGYTAEGARDGSEAIERLDQQAYDLLLLDLMMPVVSGFGVIEHLKASERPKPTVLVLTAGGKSAVEAVDETVVSGILRKPFDIQTLITAIHDAARTTAASGE